MFRFSSSLPSLVRFTPSPVAESDVRSEYTSAMSFPSSFELAETASAAEEKQTIETRTAAPSNIHGSSLQASKILPWEQISSSTFRFCPPRMEFVATKPDLLLFPASICFHALSNQYVTRSAPPGT